MKRNYDSIIAALVGFFIIYAFTRHSGIGVSPDSVVYLSVAANIHDHGSITDFTWGPMVDFPFFYPFFLSVFLFLTGRHEILSIAPVLNGVLFGILIYLSGWIMERFSSKNKWYKWALLSCIVFSPCLLEVYSMLWSETLFLVWVLLFILATRRYFQTLSLSALLLPAMICALALVTRYSGITLLGMGGLLILCDSRLKPRKKTGHLLLFGIISCSLLLVNLVRNKMVSTTLTGFREKGLTTFGRNLHDFGNIFCSWLPFYSPSFLDKHGAVATGVGLFWVVFFMVLFIRRLKRREQLFSYEHIAESYFIVYTVFILASATISRFQPLDSRLLCPLFIPWIWGATSWVPGKISALPSTLGRVIGFVTCLCLIAFQWGQFRADYETWDGVKYAGIAGYTEDSWRDSETMDFVRKNKALLQARGATLYSNANDGIWFLTGERADMLPHKDFPKDIREFLAEDHFYVVWFDDSINPDLIPIEFISQHKKLANVYPFEDGKVYLFTSK